MSVYVGVSVCVDCVCVCECVCVRPMEGPAVPLYRELDGPQSLCELLKDAMMMMTIIIIIIIIIIINCKQEKTNKKRNLMFIGPCIILIVE